MNWYKMATEKQEEFKFFQEMPKQKATPIEETKQYQQLSEKTPEILQKLLDQCKNFKEAAKILKLYGFEFKVLDNGIKVNINNQSHLINDSMKII